MKKTLIHDALKAAQAIAEGVWRIGMYQRYNARRPFGWTTRRWVEHAAKGEERIGAFSVLDMKKTPPIFAPALVPTLAENMQLPVPITFGEHRAEHPYTAPSAINIAGMSYGSLSKSAIKALAKGAKESGCWLNSGEGALSPYHLEAGCDIILQIGTGKFGLRDKDGNLDEAKLAEVASHDAIKMIEIKLSQGGKPGKGGYLPGDKVRGEVAALIGVNEGEDATSPAQHREVSDLPSLFAWLHHLRELTGKPVGFKCAATDEQEWLALCEAMAQRPHVKLPDFIAVDGGNAGTGGAPQTLMQSMGLPLADSLPHLDDFLHEYGLRDQIKLIASGHILTPDQAAAAFTYGADVVALGRGPMLAMGCVQALQCHRNVCPMGITAHNPILEARFNIGMDKGEKVGNYIRAMREEVEMIAASCGLSSASEL